MLFALDEDLLALQEVARDVALEKLAPHAARVDEEDLEAGARPAVREESGAELRHARRLSWPTARGSPGPSRSCRHRRPACRAGSP